LLLVNENRGEFMEPKCAFHESSLSFRFNKALLWKYIRVLNPTK
jgi:hypothetical protein